MKYAKGLVAAAGAVAQTINVALLPDAAKPWFGVLVALLTAAGVYQVKNTPASPPA